jgi:antitoxin (DNA-binding transcriptional repressor) of toxin-antitoxin stability system
VAMSPVRAKDPAPKVDGDEVLVYSMRELSRQTVRIMMEIEQAGRPAIITRDGRFVAIITPLAPGQVESRVLPEMARQFAKRDQGRPVAAITARPRWSRALLARL